MKKLLLILCTLILFTDHVFSENMGHIRVEIKGIKDRPKGVLSCSIFNSKEDFLIESKSLQTLDAKLSSGSAFCEFDVPMNKEYAVAVLDDENGNRILDKTTFGAPKEGCATSKNITHPFSAPDFDESKVLLEEKPLTLILIMHY